MLYILMFTELAGASAVASIIAWLRRYSGARDNLFFIAARYAFPFDAFWFFLFALLMAGQWVVTGQEPQSHVTVNWALGCGVVLAVLVVWLVFEACRYRARMASDTSTRRVLH